MQVGINKTEWEYCLKSSYFEKHPVVNANAHITKEHWLYDYISQFQKVGKIAFLRKQFELMSSNQSILSPASPMTHKH